MTVLSSKPKEPARPHHAQMLNPSLDSHPLIGNGYQYYPANIHKSNIELLHRCPRRFLYSERFHLQPKGRYSPALFLGQVFHKIMEVYITSGDLEKAVAAASELQHAALVELQEATDEMGLLPNGKAADSVTRALKDDYDKARVMAEWAIEKAPWPDSDAWEVLGVELPISVRYSHLKSKLCGTIDLLLRKPNTHEVWIVDYKTTSFSPKVLSATYIYDLQSRLYRRLVEALPLDPKDVVTGICHNVIRKPTIRFKRNQEWEDYLEEIKEWYEGSGRWLKAVDERRDDPPFIRSWVRFPQGDAARQDDIELSQQIMEADEAASFSPPSLAHYPRHSAACFEYNSICPYYELCVNDPTAWRNILNLKYEVGHRDDDRPGLQEIEVETPDDFANAKE